MNITSVPFLFLFLPICLLFYYLIPNKKSLVLQNVFLLLVSLFFYAWGEPIGIFYLCILIVVNWLLGCFVDGKKGTKLGKWIVFIAVLINVGSLFVFKYLDFTLENIGFILGQELPLLGFTLPLGLSFFCFQAISYVVDIYRGKVKSTKNLLNASLYLSIFFKMTQRPIVQYNQFESQLISRKTTWTGFCDGFWRFAIGLAKKMLIASNIGYVVTDIFATDIASLPVISAWLGCFAYMIQIFFDFAGYSDMAIGLGKMFGFEIPENFNYPYISTSVTGYWQRWHITLGAWFRDYMFYPLTLGPAIRMRKFLAKKKVNKNVAKFIQNLFVTGCIWLATGIWHGATWNYVVWGLINGAFIIWELYKKPLKNKKFDSALGWLYTIAVAFFTKAIVCTPDMGSAFSYFGAMFGLNGNSFVSDTTLFYFREYWIFIVIGTLACFPIYTKIKEKLVNNSNNSKKVKTILYGIETVALLIVFIISIAYSFKNGYTAFIYQKF